ncbi:hypothetical protein BDA99DRAFT_226353 [Phascolomyces articulosus]|uniref:Uncharacterized protein n=1 Tax=Phascolomyces articulosus TaxID=60185 RepID=A0AAD5JQA6_9FUNG|nr:hypothetical protein BDA99DRAFT_226353 [Phascolomyces articulosus]
MNAIQNESMVLSETTKEISALENVLEHIKEGFARKLKLYDRKNDTNGDEMAAIVAACEGSNNNPSQSTTPSSANNITASSSSSSTTTNNPSNKTSQTFAAWGNKLSKSVERMKLESSRTSEHQHSTYIQALIQVFTLAQVLDSWRMQYTEIIGRVPHDKVLSYAMFLTRLQACTETLEKIVCAFVLRDVTLLVHKWIKRSREWSLE